MELLHSLDLIVDVGQQYDPQLNRFDHHQREFTGTFGEDYNIKLSGSGLIYKHFGKQALRKALEDLFLTPEFAKYKMEISEEELDTLYVQMYQNLF